MALRNLFRINRKTFFNPAGWIDYQGLKNQNQTIWNSLRDIFKPPTPLHDETFEEAMKRLELTEQDVASGSRRYRLFAFLFVFLGTLTFAYSFYLLFRYFTLSGFVLSLAACGLFFAQAFKYDFWGLQMRRRQLGLTYTDWKNNVLGIKGPSND